jgi:hypothetical protein
VAQAYFNYILAVLGYPHGERLDEARQRRDGGGTKGWPVGLDVKQAADELGISSDAVRKRIARGTLRSGKHEDGSVRVWLDGVDHRRDDDQPYGGTEAGHRLDDLIDAKDDALRDLRDQLEHMRRESERKDAIIMQMAQANAALAARVPELEAPGGRENGASEPPEEGVGVVDKEPEKRSWWRRFFGFRG